MLQKYGAFARVAWSLTLEYRAQILIWMMASLLMIVMLMVWLSISANGAVNGYSSGDFIAYYMIGWFVRVITAVWSSWELDAHIRQGTLSPLLLRPIHPIHNEIAANWAEKLARLFLVVPITIGVFIFTPATPLNLTAASVVLFAISIFGAWLLVFLSDYLVGMLAFWTSQTSAFIMMLYGVRMVLSGIIAPLAMFPQSIQSALKFTPFPYMLTSQPRS